MPKRKIGKKRPGKRVKKTLTTLKKGLKNLPKNISRSSRSTKMLFLIGIVCIGISLLYHLHEITKYSFSQAPSPVKVIHRMPRPAYITIEGTDMSFPVVDTTIQNNVWQIADDGASHLAISANPGENGTIIMYGHNTLARFGSLPYVFLGQHISLITSDKKDHEYTIGKTIIVDPNNTKILTSQKGEVLLLYTCYGFADLKRFVVLAYPVKPQ